MPIYIVLLGPPGAGKGTQAKLLAKELGLVQVSTGDLFRTIQQLDTPFARRVQSIMSSGNLVPDDITNEMVRQRLAEPDCAGGAILDGFPRNTAQADALAQMLAEDFSAAVTAALLIEVPHDVISQRILKRAEEEGRSDDTPQVVEERLRVYAEKTAPLINYYAEKGLLERIEGTGTVEAVHDALRQAVDQRVAS